MIWQAKITDIADLQTNKREDQEIIYNMYMI